MTAQEGYHLQAKMQYFIIVLVLVFGSFISGELTEFFNFKYDVCGVYKNEDETLGIKLTSREGALHTRNLDGTTYTLTQFVNQQKDGSLYPCIDISNIGMKMTGTWMVQKR